MLGKCAVSRSEMAGERAHWRCSNPRLAAANAEKRVSRWTCLVAANARKGGGGTERERLGGGKIVRGGRWIGALVGGFEKNSSTEQLDFDRKPFALVDLQRDHPRARRFARLSRLLLGA